MAQLTATKIDEFMVGFEKTLGTTGNYKIEKQKKKFNTSLGGGFKDVLCSPLPGEIPILTNIFSKGLKPPTSSS